MGRRVRVNLFALPLKPLPRLIWMGWNPLGYIPDGSSMMLLAVQSLRSKLLHNGSLTETLGRTGEQYFVHA